MKFENYKSNYKVGHSCLYLKDSQGRFHNDNNTEPSFIWTDGPNIGYEYWYWHGQYHRVGGPAVSTPDRKEWWRLYKKHRLNAPAYIYLPFKEYWEFGSRK